MARKNPKTLRGPKAPPFGKGGLPPMDKNGKKTLGKGKAKKGSNPFAKFK